MVGERKWEICSGRASARRKSRGMVHRSFSGKDNMDNGERIVMQDEMASHDMSLSLKVMVVSAEPA